MKKILFVLVLLVLCYLGFVFYNKNIKTIPVLEIEDESVNIDNLYIYGTHLNINGTLVDDSNLELILYNGKFLEYKINIKDDEFNLSDYVNDGLYLENIPIGKYYAFLRASEKGEDDELIYRYYRLNNKTEYTEMNYYTFKENNNKIVIDSNNDYNTLSFNVSKNRDDEIYDIVIDPGHGGRDSGASKNGYDEADLTMKIAINLKKKLESNGFSVKLTRAENQLSSEDKLNDYGNGGRAVISSEVHAKYVFSIHLNSSNYSYVNGIELYTADNINYDFIRTMANNIHKEVGINYSSSRLNKKYDGVYTKVFTEEDIIKARKDFVERKMTPYDVTTNSNYYFMIRETGGIITGAYVDERNENVDGNPYYNSNIGAEAYLLELGYLSNNNDLNTIVNNIDKYTKAISETCNLYFNK